MRRGLTRYDKEFRTLASSDDDSCPSSELDLLNPRVARSYRRSGYQCRVTTNEGNNSPNLLESRLGGINRHRPFTSCNHVETKLLPEKKGTIFTGQRASSLQSFPSHIQPKKYEPQVTFAKQSKSSNSLENLSGTSYTKLCENEKSTPRILRAIRRNSRKFDPQEDRTNSPKRPQPENSKSSVVVLYHEKSSIPVSPLSKPLLRSSPLDRAIKPDASQQQTETAQPSFPDSRKPVESPEDTSPEYPIGRRKATLRRRHRLSRRQEPLNVHTYRDSRVPQIASLSENHRGAFEETRNSTARPKKPTRHLAKSARNLITPRERSLVRQSGDSDYPDREKNSNYRQSWNTSNGRCRSPDNSAVKLMARSSPRTDGDSEQRRANILCPNLGYLMQQMHARPRERGDDRAFISVNDGDDTKRVFPFQPTPSGNLKIIPNQVVFESKKVSVLVADPRHTKVNVKAELSRPGIEPGRCASDSSARPGLIDLPPGVTSSTINHLQAQKKLPNIEPHYKPRMQPFRPKVNQTELEQKRETMQSTSHQIPSTQEVPLSALGFTSEQPIDWDNIILPEKTDLYQELARRITNYKNADCIVRIDQDEFHCHLLVLQSYSIFFDEKNLKEIDLTGTGVSSKAFSIIYDWMISPPNESCHLLQRDNILEIFTAAQFLGIKELEEQCWAFIDNDELFTEDTAFLLYLEAKKIRNTAVMELMVPRIMKFFLMLVSSKDFLELTMEELCLLLKSNYICVNSEMEVLMSAVRWLMHDWENRKQYMLNVLKCVRFGLIAPWQLVDVKRNPENPEFMELMSYPEVQKMVDDGLAFVIIKYWYGNQTEDYYHWIELLGLTEPTNRNWAGEDKNYVTYNEFLLYLGEYQKTKLLELRSHKSQGKPSPPKSPPKDSSFLSSGAHNNYIQNFGQCGVVNNNVSSCSKHAKTMPLSYLPPAMADGMLMPTELVNEYWSNMEKNNAKGNHRAHENDNTVAFDARYHGGGESQKIPYKSTTIEKQPKEHHHPDANEADVGKFDYESRERKNAADVCRCRQWELNRIFSAEKQQIKSKKPRDSEERTDSAKSEEEAATTIQAVYRGYKARRRFDEIRKSTSDEKRNVRKVAELLAIPVGETVHEPLDIVRISNSSVSQVRKEKNKKPLALSPRMKKDLSPTLNRRNQYIGEGQLDQTIAGVSHHASTKQKNQQIMENLSYPSNALKSIRTIKSPAFFSNYDERTSSMSPSDNTDTDDPVSPRVNAKSMPMDLNSNIANDNNATKHIEAGDTVQRTKPGSKEIQTRPSNYKWSLPQRISNSMLGSNADRYFFDKSLYFPDRESVLVFGGVDPHEEYGTTGHTGKDIYRFKADENVWEFVGEIPQARHHHSVAYLKGRIYIVGGADPGEDNLHRKSIAVGSVWSYDPTTRVWFNEPGMLTARKDFGLVVSHGKMYAMGGQGRNGIALRTMEAFDPSDCTWREMQPMHTARMGPASVKYRDLIWVAGGMTKSKKELFSKDVECYDPIKNLWLKAVSLKSPRCFASFYVVSDCLYVIGGASTTENETRSIDNVDIWDANSCLWKEQTNMSIARHGHCVGSIGDQLLIIGGVTTIFMKTLNSVECYCCGIEKWMKGVSPLPCAISGHGVVSLPPANLLNDCQ